MKSLFSGLFLCLIVCSVQAQKAPIKFGDIPMEDMKMNSYEKDSSASAVILVDYGQSTIVYRQNVGFTLDFERITRIKILNKEGLKWGDFTIPLYKSGSTDEKLTSLKAVTYNSQIIAKQAEQIVLKRK